MPEQPPTNATAIDLVRAFATIQQGRGAEMTMDWSTDIDPVTMLERPAMLAGWWFKFHQRNRSVMVYVHADWHPDFAQEVEQLKQVLAWFEPGTTVVSIPSPSIVREVHW